MKRPHLSIITPVLNSELFIGKAIRTVVNQQRAEAEHLIIDGGSSDRTRTLIVTAMNFEMKSSCINIVPAERIF